MLSKKGPDTGVRLYIGGFPRKTTKEELLEFCGRYGKVRGDIDIIPNKQFAFVTFTSKEEATLAMFAIQKENYKGSRLHVDWAKRRPEDKDSAKQVKDTQAATGGVPVSQSSTGSTTGGGPATGAAGGHGKNTTNEPNKPHTGGAAAAHTTKEVPLNPNRYIPGDTKEPVIAHIDPLYSEPEPLNSDNSPDSDLLTPTAIPVALPPIPNLISRVHFPEPSPPLEVTIRDLQSHDVKYVFRVKSLSILKNYLLHEANGEVSPADLFHTSSQKNDKNIFYGGVPVVHIYQDLLGKELVEPRDNKDDRENYLRKREKNKYQDLIIPPAKVPLSTKHIPQEEVYWLLASRGYENVLLNTSANGPAAPLHPEWKPLPHTYSFRKGNQLVLFNEHNGYVESFQFLLNSTNQSYRDLLPILLKYDVCIFNSNKGAFITPEQLQ